MDNNFFEKWQYRSFKKGTRFYGIRLEKDLFDDWVITLINGSLVTKMKKERFLACSNYEDACNIVEKLVNYRINKRHYEEQSYEDVTINN